jgi:hypothetical protein
MHPLKTVETALSFVLEHCFTEGLAAYANASSARRRVNRLVVDGGFHGEESRRRVLRILNDGLDVLIESDDDVAFLVNDLENLIADVEAIEVVARPRSDEGHDGRCSS